MNVMPTILLLSASLAFGAQDHQSNPLFHELTREGVDIGAKSKAVLPPPTMEDGLDAAGQTNVLRKLIEGSYDLEDFVRNSVVAPNMLQIRNIEPSNPQAPGRVVNFWFVAYGDWAKVANKEFLERAWNNPSNESKTRPLAAADLAKRKITVEPNQSFGYGTFILFSKVEISAMGHSSWSRTPGSFLVAGNIDRRFDKDAEFPNQWRSVTRNEDGSTVMGPAHTYHGAGYYVKLTRLHEPKGAIFVEGHIIFNEPNGWFDGANVLRSKLPLGLQTQVRALRREFLKTSMP